MIKCDSIDCESAEKKDKCLIFPSDEKIYPTFEQNPIEIVLG